jgi:hypothetical protein
MTDKLNILSLHQMDPPWREAVRELEFMMATYAPQHNCLIHDISLPLPECVKQIQFHAIILGPTFLCHRYDAGVFERTRTNYDWIKDTEAVKIALPQDDYDCSGLLDRWMVSWNVDLVYTVCPAFWQVLYPTYSSVGKIKLGFTGYIADRWVKDWATTKRHEDRLIDVSYRASKLPANFGSVGSLKSRIAERFVAALPNTALKLDISTDPKDIIPGSAWHDFLGNSKFCLTTPSGSSLLDPERIFRQKVKEYTALHPTADFNQIAERCFKGEDRKYVFTAMSPRNIEAALAGTVQIATPGSYSDLMRPFEHYIPLEEDCSNIADVLKMMQDPVAIQRIARNCKELMLNTPQLHFKHHVGQLLEFIQQTVSYRSIIGSSQEQTEKYIEQYAQNIEAASRPKPTWKQMIDGLNLGAAKLRARLRRHVGAD